MIWFHCKIRNHCIARYQNIFSVNLSESIAVNMILQANVANMKPLHWNEHASITFRNCEEINYSAMNLKSLLKVQQNSVMKNDSFISA